MWDYRDDLEVIYVLGIDAEYSCQAIGYDSGTCCRFAQTGLAEHRSAAQAELVIPPEVAGEEQVLRYFAVYSDN